jgi:hypothetical protein
VNVAIRPSQSTADWRPWAASTSAAVSCVVVAEKYGKT